MLRPFILVTGAVVLIGCGDTPTVPQADGNPQLTPTASFATVEKYEKTAGYALNDRDAGLWSTLGFDRAGWCEGGGDLTNFSPWLGMIQVTKIEHKDGSTLFKTKAEGVLQAGEGDWRNCDDPVLAEGEGTLSRVRKDEKITVSWEGNVITEAGTEHSVSAWRSSKVYPVGEGRIEVSPEFGGS